MQGGERRIESSQRHPRRSVPRGKRILPIGTSACSRLQRLRKRNRPTQCVNFDLMLDGVWGRGTTARYTFEALSRALMEH